MTGDGDDPAREPAEEADAPGPTFSQGQWVPPPFEWEKHSEAENALIRRRQRARSIVTALLLGALFILLFAISVAKIRSGTP